jgi:hypothetical protein
VAENLYELEKYAEAEKKVEKLITSFDLLNNNKSLIDMKLLKYQIMWMTGENKKEVIRSIKELTHEITDTDQDAVDQRIRLETTIINCLEKIGGWENMREANKCKKRLADLEELVTL